jgi:precorrin-4 methylase/DMSO/TMAO reductase YedYZ molybdopterin-dependent catalytic subunit
MQKIFSRLAVLLIACFSFSFAVNSWAGSLPAVSITGAVRQPLNLSLEDLQRFETVTVRLNEVTMDRQYHGAFYLRGVPLRTLLELAAVQKEETGFSKQIDLAILVRNKDGKQAVLSWGEVFYSNPAEVILAFSATPIIPHTDCNKCHGPEKFKKWLDVLSRPVGQPKLVVANDFYADRSLEDVTNIEVLDLHLKMENKKKENLFSPGFMVTGAVKKKLTVSRLDSYQRVEALAKMIGDGAGYHGLESYSGVLLSELLNKAGVRPDMNQGIVVSAPDGYRTLLSCGEVFLSSRGKSIMVADKMANKPLEKGGKFKLILSDDLAADRTIKAVSNIEVVTFSQKPRLYVIGVGCADTSLITLEAISYIGKADVFVCPDDIQKRFAQYMGNKPILFDPLRNTEYMFKKEHPNLPPEEMARSLKTQRAADIQRIRDALTAGKNVALLEYGDPTVYGGWMFWLDEFKDKTQVIPGISAFNAANAMLGRHLGCKGSIVITVPQGLQANEAMLKAVADNGDTLVIFIGLRELKNLRPLLQKYYANKTPVHLVYRAGYSDSEYIIKTSLQEVVEAAEKEKEQHLGLIYIGPCLD